MLAQLSLRGAAYQSACLHDVDSCEAILESKHQTAHPGISTKHKRWAKSAEPFVEVRRPDVRVIDRAPRRPTLNGQADTHVVLCLRSGAAHSDKQGKQHESYGTRIVRCQHVSCRDPTDDGVPTG